MNAMSLWQSPPTRAPQPTAQDITRALADTGGGPVGVGPLAFAVCEVMGIDVSQVHGSYRLRSHFSWNVYLTRLKELAASGQVVVRSRQQWHRLTDGALFARLGNPTVRAYATQDVARAITEAMASPAADPDARLHDLALRVARQRVPDNNEPLIRQYAAQWLRQQEGPTHD